MTLAARLKHLLDWAIFNALPRGYRVGEHRIPEQQEVHARLTLYPARRRGVKAESAPNKRSRAVSAAGTVTEDGTLDGTTV